MNLKYEFKVRWWNWLLTSPFVSGPYFFSRRLIGGLPKGNVSDARFENAERYRDTFLEYGDGKIEDATCFEFGAGREMFISLCQSAWGFKRIISYDLTAHVRPDLLNLSRDRIREKIGLPSTTTSRLFDWSNYQSILLEDFRIEYRAPADASATDLPDASIDYVYANAVLEHVPDQALRNILRECRRLLKPNGIAAFEVDYRDHARDGKSVSPYHFLRFTEKEWAKYTHCDGGHNRKRHRDYKELFNDAGLVVVSDAPVSPFDSSYTESYRKNHKMRSAETLIAELRQTPISQDFAHYSEEELAILTGFWVLRKQ